MPVAGVTSAGHSGSHGGSSATHTMLPTWHGFVHSTHDALVILEACLLGRLHHIPRRPHDRERGALITSGNIFVYEENASGIKRWTDGMTWSPSRIMGNFLVYRELNPSNYPSGGKKVARKRKRNRSPDLSAGESGTSELNSPTVAEEDRRLVGSLVDSYGFKPDGLVKRTLTVQYKNVAHHLISYYTVKDVKDGKLKRPEFDSKLKPLKVRPDLLNLPFKQPIHDAEDMDPAMALVASGTIVPLGSLQPQTQYGQQFAVQPHMQGFHSVRQNSVQSQHPIQTSYPHSSFGTSHAMQLNISPVYPTTVSNPPSIAESPVSHTTSPNGYAQPVTFGSSCQASYTSKDQRNDSVWNAESANALLAENLLLDNHSLGKRHKVDTPVCSEAIPAASIGTFYDDTQLAVYDASHFNLDHGLPAATAADYTNPHELTSAMNGTALSATAFDSSNAFESFDYSGINLQSDHSFPTAAFEENYDAFSVANANWTGIPTDGVGYVDLQQPQQLQQHHHHSHLHHSEHNHNHSQHPIATAGLS